MDHFTIANYVSWGLTSGIGLLITWLQAHHIGATKQNAADILQAVADSLRSQQVQTDQQTQKLSAVVNTAVAPASH